MKKCRACVVCLLILLSLTTMCYAGDIPVSLLNLDANQVFFGEIKDITGETIAVIQQTNIKGEFNQDVEISGKRTTEFVETPEVGEKYLCGFMSENGALYLWEVTGDDPETLEIKQTDTLSQEMQKYLNEGEFAKKEEERLVKLTEAEAFANRHGESEPPAPPVSELPEPAPAGEGGMHPALLQVLLCALVAIGCALFLSRRNRHRSS